MTNCERCLMPAPYHEMMCPNFDREAYFAQLKRDEEQYRREVGDAALDDEMTTLSETQREEMNADLRYWRRLSSGQIPEMVASRFYWSDTG